MQKPKKSNATNAIFKRTFCVEFPTNTKKEKNARTRTKTI